MDLKLSISDTGPLGDPRQIDLTVGEKRIKAVNHADGELYVNRPLYGYELPLARALDKCMTDRFQDQHRLFHLEGVISDARKAGEEAVLKFVKNGRFLTNDSLAALFAKEIEEGWRNFGKAEADRLAEAEVKVAVAARITEAAKGE